MNGFSSIGQREENLHHFIFRFSKKRTKNGENETKQKIPLAFFLFLVHCPPPEVKLVYAKLNEHLGRLFESNLGCGRTGCWNFPENFSFFWEMRKKDGMEHFNTRQPPVFALALTAIPIGPVWTSYAAVWTGDTAPAGCSRRCSWSAHSSRPYHRTIPSNFRSDHSTIPRPPPGVPGDASAAPWAPPLTLPVQDSGKKPSLLLKNSGKNR